jgi:hypothetical protein
MKESWHDKEYDPECVDLDHLAFMLWCDYAGLLHPVEIFFCLIEEETTNPGSNLKFWKLMISDNWSFRPKSGKPYETWLAAKGKN